jgi:hypothetical protein
MDEIPTDGLENTAEFDKGLWIIVGARGPTGVSHERPNMDQLRTIYTCKA